MDKPTVPADLWPATTVEVWLPIRDQKYYEVSSLGRVRSLDRTVEKMMPSGAVYTCTIQGRVLSQWSAGDGYKAVRLGRARKDYVHRLVCEAFHGESDLQVAHWNGNKHDNRASNLRWATSQENNLDKRRHGTHRRSDPLRGERHPMAKLNRDQVEMIRKTYKRGLGNLLAEQLGVSYSSVCRVARMESWRDGA